MKKLSILHQAVFLALCGATGYYYWDLGTSSKAYVALFGLVELFLVLLSVIAFIVMLFKRRKTVHSGLVMLYFILSMMQFCPLGGSIVILNCGINVYTILHAVMLAAGASVCWLLRPRFTVNQQPNTQE